jgi:hypothetical protein
MSPEHAGLREVTATPQRSLSAISMPGYPHVANLDKKDAKTPGDLQLDSSETTSSRLLFAMASEMIRVEIAAAERRIATRLDAERIERNSICDRLSSDMEALAVRLDTGCIESKEICDKISSEVEALVGIVESLSSQGKRTYIDSLLEEERQLRALSLVNLHCKLDALVSQVSTFQTAHTDESLGSLSEDPIPQKSEPDDKYLNALLEQERRARDVACAQLRTDLCKEFSGTWDLPNNPTLLEQERLAHNATCSAFRAEICKDLEVMSKDIRSVAVRVPQFESMEAKLKDLEVMSVQLGEDFEDLRFRVKHFLEPRALARQSALGFRACSGECRN